MTDEVSWMIDATLRDRARISAPPRLRRSLERQHLHDRHLWVARSRAAAVGAIVAATLTFILGGSSTGHRDEALEAVGDHQRILVGRDLGVEVSDLHQVKPWFADKLEFVPPVAFLGDDEFPLRGGDIAVFLGHRAAAFIYTKRRHTISLFVFESHCTLASEQRIRGFEVMTWGTPDFGFALVSDASAEDVRALRGRLR